MKYPLLESMKPNDNVVFADRGGRYSAEEEQNITLNDVQTIQAIGRKSINDFGSDEIQKTKAIAQKYFKEMGVKSPFFRAWYGDWRASDTTPLNSVVLSNNATLPSNYITNKDTNITAYLGSQLKRETVTHSKGKSSYGIRMKLLNNSQAAFENAILLDTKVAPPTGNKSKQSLFMHDYYGIAEDNGKPYLYKLMIEEYLNNGEVTRRGYEIKDIKIKPISSSGSGANAPFLQPVQIGSINSVSDLFGLVKQNDSAFNPVEASKIVNEDGTPKVMYHSSRNKFTAFKKGEQQGLLGKGIYFTDYPQQFYGDNTFKVFLKANNPVLFSDLPDGARELSSSGLKMGGIPDFFEKFPQYDAIISRDEVVVKDPTQIKSVDNIGTFDKTNPDIRFSVKEGNEDTDINEIVNSDMTDAEKRRALEDRAHFIPQGGRDIFTEGQKRGKDHFDNMYKVKPSEYSEEDWKSYGEEFGTDNMRRDIQQRSEEAERRDREAFNERFKEAFPDSAYSEEDWDNLTEPVDENYDWTKDGRNWNEAKPKQPSEAEKKAEAQSNMKAMMEERGVSRLSELAEDTVSRADIKKAKRKYYLSPKGIHEIGTMAYTRMVDDMHPFWNYTNSFEKTQTRIDENGKKVKFVAQGKQNPYKMAMNAKDASSRSAYLITDYLTDFDVNIIGKGLNDTIADSGITQKNT